MWVPTRYFLQKYIRVILYVLKVFYKALWRYPESYNDLIIITLCYTCCMSNLLVSSCGCYLSTGEEPSTVTDEMVEDLFVEVNQFTLVCMSVCV